MWVENNAILLQIDGLSNLTSIGGNLVIKDNAALTQIDGLSNLTSIGGNLSIRANGALSQIDGLSDLVSISGYLVISNNPSLPQIGGLSNLTFLGEDLYLSSNSVLTDCCAIQYLLSTPGAIGGFVQILNNPSECSSEIEILEGCELRIQVVANPPCIGVDNGSIQVSVFYSAPPPCFYTWERLEDGQIDSGISNDENFTINDLEAGTYNLMVIDAVGDTAIQNGIVLTPIPGSVFEILEITTTNSSNNLSNGSITITVGGGTAPYDYSWSGLESGVANNINESNYTIDFISQGEYSITVTDNSGLQQTVEVFLLDETVPVFPCTQPLDVVVLNDVSSSVDAVEYAESKTFFADFVSAMNIGPGADESRAAIIEWASGDDQSIQIPMSDNLADLQNYINNTRAFDGGTDPQDALIFGKDYLESVARPDVQRVLVLSTDGSGGQISPSLVALADQYKAAGYHIITIAFDGAFSNTYTRDLLRQVASIDALAPGAPAYSLLDQNLAENIVTIYLCPIDPGSSATAYFNRDGAIDITNIEAIEDCPNPEYVDITFTVEALQQLSIPAGTPITFYYNNPALFGSTPILTWQIPCAIPTGTTEIFTASLPVTAAANIFSVLNDDGSQSPPVTLPITDIEELAYSNNIDNETVCTDPLPTLQAFKYTTTPQPICNNTVIYTVDVCNISALDATSVEIMDMPPADFVLLGESLNLNGCAIQNGTAFDIPAGCCVSITYTYDATNAPNGFYNDQDVLISGTGGQVYNSFDGAGTSAEDVTIDGTVDCPSTVIEFTKSVNVSESCEDAFVVYTFTIDNQLNIPLQGIAFSDVLPSPATWTFQPYNLSGLSIAAPIISGSSATFVIDQIEANTAATFSMDAALGDWIIDGSLDNTATLSDVPDLENGGFQVLSSNTVVTDISAAPEIVDLPDTIYVEADEAAIQLSATLNGLANIAWTTSGDGSFSDSNSISTTYNFGIEDIANEAVSLFIVTESDCGSNGQGVIILINEPCPVLDMTLSFTDVLCNDNNDGTANVHPNNGTPPYSYNWSNSEIDSAIVGLIAGDYTVTVTDANDCSTIDSTTLNEPNPLIATISVDDNLCFGENEGRIVFETVEGGTMPYSYSIDGINFSSQIAFNELPSGIYRTIVQDANGCIYDEDIAIEDEGDAFYVDLGADATLSLGDSLLIIPEDNLTSVDTFIWSGVDCIDCPEVIVMPNESQFITLTIFDTNGCSATDSIFLAVSVDIYVPNIFSPNDDNINDQFYPYSGSDRVEILEFAVFNRWGSLVYENKNFMPNTSTYGWDGTFKGQELDSGVFAWYLTASINGETKILKGDVVLVR